MDKEGPGGLTSLPNFVDIKCKLPLREKGETDWLTVNMDVFQTERKEGRDHPTDLGVRFGFLSVRGRLTVKGHKSNYV